MTLRDLDLKGFYGPIDDRLNKFFVPVLKNAVSYDRIAGYFTSSSLSTTARGLSHFIAAEGKMRLIAGADLSEADHHALESGKPLPDVVASALVEDPIGSADVIVSRRLEVLAWLVAEGRLEIKIGVPLGPEGRPLKRAETDAYFHSKYGVFSDTDGNRVAFIGSDNETEAGIRHHHESFTVAKSWIPEVWSEHGIPIVDTFERHWTGSPDPGWAVLDLPDAVEQDLISLRPTSPPPRLDPEEAELAEADDILLRFMVAAPRIAGGTGVGFATSGVTPWPHQSAISSRLVDTFPRSYLLADEVGLGKTIEVGLVLRELLASGRAETALLLVPAGVMRQWQEELKEKFALDVPRYENGTFLDASDKELLWAPPLWSAFPIVLASSHLARRRDRRTELIEAGPWDVVLVDEAHHARRSGTKPTATPNTLLALLQQMGRAGSWRSLYLASATPMQMHPHEAWDLLELLGLPGEWGQSAANFVRYYEELRKPFTKRDWPFLYRMARDFFLDVGAGPDPVLEAQLRDELGMAGSRFIRDFASTGLTSGGAEEMGRDSRTWMDEWLRAHTPMRDRVFRTSRNLLRVYQEQGILDRETVIPHRRVSDRFVDMKPDEAALYKRIETYISRYYDAYMQGPAARKPLGFIMTVYRRRLTSSFLAIERSLQRRLDSLKESGSLESMLDLDDLIGLESSASSDFDRLEARVADTSEEIEELEAFLGELRDRPPDETKMEKLHDELVEAFSSGHDTALIFTQYADTMDYLGDQLLPVYGDRMVLYSGGGGRRYDPEERAWVGLSKARVKELFREGLEVKLLVGTDSLSEGLNLQTCSKLINYDVPWNFMRVEQRIGRVDRIGGKPLIEVTNYFYNDTVEEQIYRGIGEDFDWFQDVVGPAQPVLSQVEKVIESTAMEIPGDERASLLQDRIGVIRRQIEEAQARALTLSDFESSVRVSEPDSGVIDLAGLESILTSSTKTGPYFEPHPRINGAYLLSLSYGRKPVTFRRDVLDVYSPDVALVTYLSKELGDLLTTCGVEQVDLDEGRFLVDGSEIRSLSELERALSTG